MSLKRIVVMVSGGGSNLQSIMDAIENRTIDGIITSVISNKEDAYGLTRAKNAGIPSCVIKRKDYKTAEAFDQANLLKIDSVSPDLVVLAGYLSMVGPKIIERYHNKIINIHPALIPSFCGKGYYGSNVHQAALDYGVKLSGATTHFVDEGADTGPVIIQESVPVFPDDTTETLAARVLMVEHKILVESVRLFCADKLSVKGRVVTIMD